MPITRLIIALPNRLLALALADYVEAKNNDIVIGGVATDSKELFALLERCPSSVLLYDPYLPGPCPQVICGRLKQEFSNLKIILMKNQNANGRFSEAENCRPAAIIGSDALPEDFLGMVMMVNKKASKLTKPKPKKTKKRKGKSEAAKTANSKPLLSQREQEMVSLIARGHSAREIAFVLDISYNTARTHTRNILTKLNLGSKVQLIAWHASK